MRYSHQYQPGLWSVADPEAGIIAHGVSENEAADLADVVEPEAALWRSIWAAAVTFEAQKAKAADTAIQDDIGSLQTQLDTERKLRESLENAQTTLSKELAGERAARQQREFTEERDRLIQLLIDEHGGRPEDYLLMVTQHLKGVQCVSN